MLAWNTMLSMSGGDVRQNAAGHRFAELDVDDRKRLVREHRLAYVPPAGLIRRVLDERESHRAPFVRLCEELEDYMSEPRAEETMRTITSWGRYAELFGYDKQERQFNLENPN